MAYTKVFLLSSVNVFVSLWIDFFANLRITEITLMLVQIDPFSKLRKLVQNFCFTYRYFFVFSLNLLLPTTENHD